MGTPNKYELPTDLADMVANIEGGPLGEPMANFATLEPSETMTSEQAQAAFIQGQIAAGEATEDIAATLCPGDNDEDPETLHSVLKSMRDEQRLTRMALERIAAAAEKALGG